MDIRTPTLADAEQLGRLHVRAWQSAYRGGLMPDVYLDALSIEDRAEMWREGLGRPPRARRSRLVATIDDGVIGFILTGPADGDDDAEDGEVYALNVDPDHWGSGAGRALLDAGVGSLADEGFEHLVLWVHPGNDRARRFYEHAGWRPDGERREQEVHGVVVPEVRYRRSAPLADGRAPS